MRRSVAVESVSPPVSSVMTGTFQELPITDIHESALLTNPRATFDPDALDELAASIRLHGVLQPILVRPRSHDSGYELIAGARRLRASRLAQIATIPAHVVTFDADGQHLPSEMDRLVEPVLNGDVAEEVGKLRQEQDGDIVVHGSAQLVQTLVEHDLVDEFRLMVYPVVLGSGKRLFGETSDKKPLRLVDSKVVGDGVAILIYEPAKP